MILNLHLLLEACPSDLKTAVGPFREGFIEPIATIASGSIIGVIIFGDPLGLEREA